MLGGPNTLFLTISVLNFGPVSATRRKLIFMVDFVLFMEFFWLSKICLKTLKRASNTELLKSNFLKPLSLVIMHTIIIAY